MSILSDIFFNIKKIYSSVGLRSVEVHSVNFSGLKRVSVTKCGSEGCHNKLRKYLFFDVQTFHHQTFNHPTLNHDRVRV